MQVELLAHTQNAKEIIYTACRTCYSEQGPISISRKAVSTSEDDKIKLIEKVFSRRHLSTSEHIAFTFAIEGISRACSHQLVRHRHCSFSQQSQRYVSLSDGFDCVVPKGIKRTKYAEWVFDKAMKDLQKMYNDLITEGIEPEDARSILPNACCTNMVLTINLRELMHICNERLCTKAQQEIRELVMLMRNEVLKQEPWLQKYLTPKCELLGFCNELKGCGRKSAR